MLQKIKYSYAHERVNGVCWLQLVLMVFWLMVTCGAVLLVAAQNSEKAWLSHFRFSQ